MGVSDRSLIVTVQVSFDGYIGTPSCHVCTRSNTYRLLKVYFLGLLVGFFNSIYFSDDIAGSLHGYQYIVHFDITSYYRVVLVYRTLVTQFLTDRLRQFTAIDHCSLCSVDIDRRQYLNSVTPFTHRLKYSSPTSPNPESSSFPDIYSQRNNCP